MLRILGLLAALTCCASPAFSETLNSFRHAHGLPALQRSGALQAMAQRHARSMAMRRTIDHSGFYTERGKAGARAENVAAGCASESCAIALWAASSGHRENMLLADVRKYGLASAGRYWCLVLGR
ncbi:MAG: CAP domain-containing protein [Pseudolabrys sp.]